MGAAEDLDLPGLAQLGVDEALIATRVRLDGQNALDLLAELPVLAAQWQWRLGLRGAHIMPGGVRSAVLACRRVEDETMVVLKLSGAHARNARAEAATLSAWGGVGACALRRASDDGRVMLLDAIQPGVAVVPGVVGADGRRAGDLLRLLHRLPTDRIPSAVPCAARELRWRFGGAALAPARLPPPRRFRRRSPQAQPRREERGQPRRRPPSPIAHGRRRPLQLHDRRRPSDRGRAGPPGHLRPSLHGPNGFFRHFSGPVVVDLADAYGTNRHITLRGTVEIIIDTSHSGGWYDIALRTPSDARFSYQLAGRLESSARLTSDPQFGRS